MKMSRLLKSKSRRVAMSKYFIDREMSGHKCCWDVTICYKVEKSEDIHGRGVASLLECMDDDAEFICNALNKAQEAWDKLRSLKL